MTDPVKTAPDTVLQALLAALEKTEEYNRQDQVRPVVVLWTDGDRQWEVLAPRLREALRHFLTFDVYAPGSRSGPAIWLRCMLDRALPEADWLPEVTPILYLPGVSRRELRAVEECPRPLRPLAELQYRGVFFSQANGKDWTVSAFLSSTHGGLGLDVGADRATAEAILQASPKLADTPVAELRGRRLEASDFHALLAPDLIKDLLRWLNDPKGTEAAKDPAEWAGFLGACREKYGFDPSRDGALVAAERLGSRDGPWGPVWARFAEAPQAYPNLPQLLRRAKPVREDLFFKRECWPQCNEDDEKALRSALAGMDRLAPDAAASEVERLESAHGARRAWVWAALGQAPLAQALESLVRVAQATRKKLGGVSLETLAEAYVSEAWRVDGAVLDALAAVSSTADADAVRKAADAIYRVWLEAGAEQFQSLVRRQSLPPGHDALPKQLAAVDPGACVLFADGLRFDLGRRLRAVLEKRGFVIDGSWRWVPVPSVTPTAKPAASPIADLLGPGPSGDDFLPMCRDSGKALTIERFRQLLGERGFRVLRADELGDPAGRAWTEHGEIDTRGHQEGWKLAHRVGDEIRSLADRISALLDAGWREVRVVTDHGWLLLPLALPKVDMPAYLVECRWTRCAALKPGARVDIPTAPWHWNPDVLIAMAPGIGSFKAGIEYSHGGLSLQECLVPTLVVRAVPQMPDVTLETVKWVGLRCRVKVSGSPTGWQVDLRGKAADPLSSVAGGGKPLAADGTTSLVVGNPDAEGMAAVLVVMDAQGQVMVKRATTVGGEE